MRAHSLTPRAVALAAVMLLIHACQDGPTDPFEVARQAGLTAASADFSATCSPITERALIADAGAITAGVVRVGNDESHVLVQIETQDGWVITESQLFVGPSLEGIPVSGGGSPIPGRFPYSRRHGGGVSSYTYAVPLSVVEDAEEAVIAVHADLRLGNRREGAWGEGESIGADGSWGMYFNHGIADCVSELATSADGARIVFGGLTLVIPPGAVAQDVQITVTPKDVEDLQLPGSAAASGALASSTANVVLGNVFAIPGTAYDLGPDGLEFEAPATITLAYDEALLPDGVLEEILQVFAINGVFFALESTVDADDDLVSAPIEHFSTYFVGAPIGTVDLRLSGFGFSPATKLAGFPVTVHATAENDLSSTDAVDATLRIDFDQSVSFVFDDLPAGCVVSQPLPEVELRFECALGELEPGQQAMRDLVVRPLQTGLHNVTGTVLPVTDDPTPADNDQHGSFDAVAPVVDLRADLVAPTIVDPGDLILYQIGVLNDAGATNTLPSGTVLLEVAGDAALLVLDDACADEGSSQALSVIVRCSVPELAPGASEVFLVTIQAASPGQVIAATASTGVPTYVIDSNPDNDEENVETRVRADLEADLSVAFTDLTLSEARANLDYGFFISVASAAASPDEVSGASLSLLIEGSVTPQTLPDGCSSSSTTVPATTTITCVLADIAPGQTLPTLLLLVQANTVEIGGTLDATATVSMPAGGNDPNPDDNTAVRVVNVVAPEVDMYVAQFTESADPIDLGQTVRYTIQGGNRTSATDPAPDGSRIDLRIVTGNFDVVSVPAGCTDFSGAVVDAVLVGCETGLLDPGEVSLAYEIEIEPLDVGPFDVTAEARPHAGSIESNPADDTETHTTTVNAAVPQPSGQLAFMSTRVGPTVLHTKDLGTGTVTMFLAGGQQVFGEDPAWSPGGTQIAIGGGSLRLVPADGSSAPATLPLGNLVAPRHPRWSPDGSAIVFQAVDDNDPDEDRELFVIDVGTNAITRLTNNAVDDEAPDWASDGTDRILFIRNGSSIRTMTSAGAGDTEILAGATMRHARWSPDGQRVAFSLERVAGWSIEAFALADPADLTTLENDGENNHSPVWSPDGLLIGFVKGEPGEESPGIYFLPAAGGAPAAVLESSSGDEDFDADWK